MHGNLGELGKVPVGAMVLAYSTEARPRWEQVLQYLKPGELFSDAERAEIAAAFAAIPSLPSGKITNVAALNERLKAGVQAANRWTTEISKRLVPYSKNLARSSDASESERGRRMYRAWIPRDDDLTDFAIKAAIVVGVGYALGPLTAATPGTAATGFTPGSALPGSGAGFGAKVGTSAGGIFSAGTQTTVASTALASLKKLAIEKGIDYAMGYAAEQYAASQQKEMAREMEAQLRADLEKAQAEYDALTAQGATPEAAASQAAGKSGKFGTAGIALAALAAFLILRR